MSISPCVCVSASAASQHQVWAAHSKFISSDCCQHLVILTARLRSCTDTQKQRIAISEWTQESNVKLGGMVGVVCNEENIYEESA